MPVLGVLPYLRGLRIADEDSVSLDDRAPARRAGSGGVDVAVVRLPRISNFDDLAPLEHEPGVAVRFVDRADGIAEADLVVLPGSKCTATDLEWLRATGIAGEVVARARRGRYVLGICGGCQMLGCAVLDPDHVESERDRVEGLGLLPITTRFVREKVTAQVRARVATPSFLAAACGIEVRLLDDLRELDFGALEGLTGQEAAALHPAVYRAWMTDPAGVCFPDGENLDRLRARVLRALALVRERHPGQVIALVSHGGPIRLLVAHALGMDAEKVFRLDASFGSVTVVDWFRDGAVLRLLNHLP